MMLKSQSPGIPEDPRQLVLVLEPHQLCGGTRRYTRRPLGSAARFGLGALRVYVVIMLVLVGIQVAQLVH